MGVLTLRTWNPHPQPLPTGEGRFIAYRQFTARLACARLRFNEQRIDLVGRYVPAA